MIVRGQRVIVDETRDGPIKNSSSNFRDPQPVILPGYDAPLWGPVPGWPPNRRGETNESCLSDTRGVIVDDDYPTPIPASHETLVKVSKAGICSTDHALMDGLYPFNGVLGHEFVGTIASGPAHRVGQRVVGEINAACGHCPFCQSGLRKHCQNRTALGIRSRDGAFADFLTLPDINLHDVPDIIPDAVATLTEPLAAAFDVVEQVDFHHAPRTLVIGAGKLGQLVARAVRPFAQHLTVANRSRGKLTRLLDVADDIVTSQNIPKNTFDVCVECTGNEQGLALAMEAVRPRGTVCLKSTYPRGQTTLNTGRLVVDEIRLLGSRCGPFNKALAFLAEDPGWAKDLIDSEYAIDDAVAAFADSRGNGRLKVLFDLSR